MPRDNDHDEFTNGRQYRAYSNDPEVIERVLEKMEGQLQTLRNARPDAHGNNGTDKRPKAMPVRYVASHLGCTVGTVKRWIAHHEGRRQDYDISDRFCDIYQLIANELAEVVGAATFKIACDTSNPQALRAQLHLLPKMDPWTYGDKGTDDRESTTTADIPSAVFDAMSDAERDALAKYAADQEQIDSSVDKLLADVAARVAENEDRDDDQ